MSKSGSWAQQVLKKYPRHIPIVVKPSKSIGTPSISRKRFIIYGASNFIAMQRDVRPYIDDLEAIDTIYFFINNSLIPPYSVTISQIYEKYKADNGVLYVYYAAENTFG